MVFRVMILLSVLSSAIFIASLPSQAFAEQGLKVDQVFQCVDETNSNSSIVVVSDSNGLYGIKYFYTADMTDYQHGLLDLRNGSLKIKSSFSQEWVNAGKAELKKMNGKDGIFIRFNKDFDTDANKVFCYLL